MSAGESLSWPTPRASENENRTTRSAPTHGDGHGRVLAGVAGDLAAAMWSTPRVTTGEYTRDQGQKGAERLTLEGEVRHWSTPRGSDGEKGGIPLPAQTANWPTPASRDSKGENSADHLENGTGRLHLDQLPNFVAHVFTRPDLPTSAHGPTFSQWRRILRPLRDWTISLHGRATWRRIWKARKTRRLNPTFTEWLMAWPPGHALCACSETEFTRWQQDMRGALSQLPTASGPWIWKPPVEKPAIAQLDLFGEPLDA